MFRRRAVGEGYNRIWPHRAAAAGHRHRAAFRARSQILHEAAFTTADRGGLGPQHSNVRITNRIVVVYSVLPPKERSRPECSWIKPWSWIPARRASWELPVADKISVSGYETRWMS